MYYSVRQNVLWLEAIPSVPDSNPQRSVNNGSTTVTDTSGSLVVMAANQKERGFICHYQVQTCSGSSEWKSHINTGNTAVKKTNLSLSKRGLLSFEVAEVGNSIGYTAEGITCISSISLQGKF